MRYKQAFDKYIADGERAATMAGLRGRLGMTQKMDTFSGYPARSLEVAQCTLITAWESLGNYWDDLVVVGGLAVHYSLSREKLRAAPEASLG